MIDWNELKKKKTIVVLSWRIAEKLIGQYGIRNLIALEPSNKNPKQKAYIFYNDPELFMTYQDMIVELSARRKDREQVDREYYG